MSIFIHHGAPGSYKTSGAIWLRLLPAIKAKRLIITNVRGINWKSIAKHLRMSESDIQFIFVDTDHPDGRIRLAKFWHWSPKDAFIFIDECGRIWSPRLTPTNLKALDTPPDLVAEDRPESFETAFDMHRHHGWDICLTTPNISKVHSMIRDAAEIGYRHFNRATMGLGSKFTMTTHDATNNGLQESHAMSRQVHKVPRAIFKMYASTMTGKARDTLAGTAIWKDRRVIILSILAFSLLFFGLYNLKDDPLITGGSSNAEIDNVQSTTESTKVASSTLPSFCNGRVCFENGDVHFGKLTFKLVQQLPDIEFTNIWATGFDGFRRLTVFFESTEGVVPTELFNESFRYTVVPLGDKNEFLIIDLVRLQAYLAPVRRGTPIKVETEDSPMSIGSVF